MLARWRSYRFHRKLNQASLDPSLNHIVSLMNFFPPNVTIDYDVFRGSCVFFDMQYENVEDFLNRLHNFTTLVVDNKYIRMDLKNDHLVSMSIDDYLTTHQGLPVTLNEVLEVLRTEIERFSNGVENLSAQQIKYYNRHAQPLFDETIRFLAWAWHFRS